MKHFTYFQLFISINILVNSFKFLKFQHYPNPNHLNLPLKRIVQSKVNTKNIVDIMSVMTYDKLLEFFRKACLD